MKKYLIFLLMLSMIILLSSCKNNKLEIKRNDTKIVSLYDDTIPDIDIDVYYNNNIINDYEILFDNIIWENNKSTQKVNIKYKNQHTSFDITYLRIDEIEEINDLSFSEANGIISYINNGGFRNADTIVYYDNDNYSQTNQFGYEIAVDANYQIISSNINVKMPENGFILSAHGDKKSLLQSLNIGEVVIYNKLLQTAFIFDNNIDNIKYLIMENDLNNLIYDYRHITNDQLLLNSFDAINSLIFYYNNGNLNEFQEIYNEIRDNIPKYEYYNKEYYSPSLDLNIKLSKYNYSKEELLHLSNFQINHIEGFRNTNELVCYYKNKNTNVFGYELAIDENGFIVNEGINVDIPENGFVLSGHGDASTFLNKSFYLGDYLVLDKDNLTISHYRNPFVYTINNYYNQINDLIYYYNYYKDLNVPLYYKSFKETIIDIVNEYNNLYVELKNQKLDFNNLYQLNNNQIDELLMRGYSYLLSNSPVSNHSFWHTPGNLNNIYNELSVEGVQEFIKDIKNAGFNRIYLNILSHGKVFYDSNYLSYAKEAFNIEYGEYKDYYECFIKEAKKQGIDVYVWAIVMNFGSDSEPKMEKVPQDYYTIDFNGNYTKYLDSKNPKVQDYLCRIMKEIASYNPAGIEFDYIRYDGSNILTATNKNNVIDYGYTEYTINKFLTENNLKGDIHDLLFEVEGLKEKWVEFKTDGVTEAVIKMRDAIKSVNKNIKVTAAVFSNPTSAKQSVLQDSVSFYLNDYADELEPMIYEENYDQFISKVDNFINLISSKEDYYKYFNVGIAPLLEGTNINEYFKQIAYCEYHHYNYSIFSSSFIFANKDLLKYLSIQNTNTISLNENIKDKKAATLSYLQEIMNEYYKYYIDVDLYQSIIDAIEYDNMNTLINTINKIDNDNIKYYLIRLIEKYQ